MKMIAMTAASLLVLAAASAPARAEDKADKAELLKIEHTLADAQTLDVAMQWHDPNVLCYDWEAGVFKGYDAVKKHFAGLFAKVASAHVTIEDISIETDGKLAFANSIQHVVAKDSKGAVMLDTVFRVTDCYHKVSGKWLMLSQHNSFPIDLATGKAVFSPKV